MGTIGTPCSYKSGKYQVIAMVNNDVTITATFYVPGSVPKTFQEENGIAMIDGLREGLWTIRVEKGDHSISKQINITNGMECQIIPLYFNMVPDFNYSNNDVEIVNFKNEILSIGDLYQGGSGKISNWRIKFKTSGTLVFHDLKGQYIDIFLVGGGGDPASRCGGGSGYTETIRNFKAEEGIEYIITVAARKGDSSFKTGSGAKNPISITASHGGDGYTTSNNFIYGGSGGSGGGGGSGNSGYSSSVYVAGPCGNGGSDGNDGTPGTDGFYESVAGGEYIQMVTTSNGGTGQGRSTREFEDFDWELYAPGGAGGVSGSAQYNGQMGGGKTGDNSGAGGTSAYNTGDSRIGCSGIVIIRNSKGQLGFTDWI